MAYFSWVLGSGPGVGALRVGAVFFMGSDLILAFGCFVEAPIPNGHFWVMSTYIAAQVAGPWIYCRGPAPRSQLSVRTRPTARPG